MSANAPMRTPTPGGVVVASLTQAKKHKRKFDAVLTLEDPKAPVHDRLRLGGPDDPAHLVLSFEDIDRTDLGRAVPEREQIAQAIQFGRTNAEGSLLVHCFHGVGRSAACALAIIADREGPGNETQAVRTLIDIRPEATPNLVAVALADAILDRGGALVRALDDFERSTPSKVRARATRDEFATRNAHLYARKVVRIEDGQGPLSRTAAAIASDPNTSSRTDMTALSRGPTSTREVSDGPVTPHTIEGAGR